MSPLGQCSLTLAVELPGSRVTPPGQWPFLAALYSGPSHGVSPLGQCFLAAGVELPVPSPLPGGGPSQLPFPLFPLGQCPLSKSLPPPNVHFDQDIVAISLWHLADIEFKFDETLTVLPETGPHVSAAHDDTLMLEARSQVSAPIDVVASKSPRLPAPPGATIAEPVTLDNDDTAYLLSVSEPATLEIDTTLDMPGTGPQVSAHALIVASKSPSLPAPPGATIVEHTTLDNDDNDYLSDGSSVFVLDPISPARRPASPLDACSDASSEFVLDPFSPDRGLAFHSGVTNDESEMLNLGFRAQETTFGLSGDDVFGICGLSGVSPRALELDSQQGNAADLGESSSALVGEIQPPLSPPARADDELVLNN